MQSTHWLAGIVFSLFVVALPDEKDIELQQALQSFNVRTGQNLDVATYLVEVVRDAVSTELVQPQVDKITTEAAGDKAAVTAFLEKENDGWHGTSTPTPLPTKIPPHTETP